MDDRKKKKVIDKCDLGSLAKRERELDAKARELGLPTPTSLQKKLEKIQKLVGEDEEEED